MGEDNVVHICSQEKTLGIILEKLENIESGLKEVRADQKTYVKACTDAAIERAKYPPPDEVKEYLKAVDTHNIYFGIIGVVILASVSWLSGVLPHIIKLLWG